LDFLGSLGWVNSSGAITKAARSASEAAAAIEQRATVPNIRAVPLFVTEIFAMSQAVLRQLLIAET
jgi:hypothetical protein